MAQTVCVLLRTSDRSRLEAIASDRNQPRKYIERTLVVLASVERRPVRRVATEVAVSCPMVRRWQQRFAEAGPDGLLRDKTRKPGKPPILAGTVARVVALTCGDPPAGVTHWTGRAMAKGRRHLAALGATDLGCPPTPTHTGYAASSALAIHGLPRRWPMSSASTSIRLPTRWCCRSTRRARSKRSTARGRAAAQARPLPCSPPTSGLQAPWHDDAASSGRCQPAG